MSEERNRETLRVGVNLIGEKWGRRRGCEKRLDGLQVKLEGDIDKEEEKKK